MASKEENEASNAPALDWMKCNICLDRFTQPRVLPCLHTFCHNCLGLHADFYCSNTRERSTSVDEELQETSDRSRSENYSSGTTHNENNFNALRERLASTPSSSLPESRWRQLREMSKTFPCPTCREKIKLPLNGINGFRHDFRVSQLQEWLENLRERQNKLEKEHKTKIKHGRSAARLFKQESPGGDTSCECCFYAGEAVTIVCLDCSAGICELCSQDKHQNHKIADIKDGLEFYRYEIYIIRILIV